MASSSCHRLMSRTSLRSLKSAIKPKLSTTGGSGGAPTSRVPLSSSGSCIGASTAPPCRRFSSLLTRSPAELGCVQSLLPLHSAVAAARMTSCLSSKSSSCRALSQGTLCCTSPEL